MTIFHVVVDLVRIRLLIFRTSTKSDEKTETKNTTSDRTRDSNLLKQQDNLQSSADN